MLSRLACCLAVLMVPTTTLADVVTAATEPAPEPTIAGRLLTYATFAVLAGLVALMGLAGPWILAKVKNAKLAAFLEKNWEIAKSVVAHVAVELKPEIAKALEDGKITAEEGKALKARALALFKEALGQAGLNDASKLLGLAGGALDVFLSGVLERALNAFKASAPVVPARLETRVDVEPKTGAVTASAVAPGTSAVEKVNPAVPT